MPECMPADVLVEAICLRNWPDMTLRYVVWPIGLLALHGGRFRPEPSGGSVREGRSLGLARDPAQVDGRGWLWLSRKAAKEAFISRRQFNDEIKGPSGIGLSG